MWSLVRTLPQVEDILVNEFDRRLFSALDARTEFRSQQAAVLDFRPRMRLASRPTDRPTMFESLQKTNRERAREAEGQAARPDDRPLLLLLALARSPARSLGRLCIIASSSNIHPIRKKREFRLRRSFLPSFFLLIRPPPFRHILRPHPCNCSAAAYNMEKASGCSGHATNHVASSPVALTRGQGL